MSYINDLIKAQQAKGQTLNDVDTEEQKEFLTGLLNSNDAGTRQWASEGLAYHNQFSNAETTNKGSSGNALDLVDRVVTQGKEVFETTKTPTTNAEDRIENSENDNQNYTPYYQGPSISDMVVSSSGLPSTSTINNILGYVIVGLVGIAVLQAIFDRRKK